MLILLGYVAVTTDHEAIRRLNRGRVSSEVSKLSDGRDGERAALFVNVSHDSCEHSTREVFVLSHLARLGFSSESQVGVCGFYGCIDCKETKCHPKQSRSSPFNLSTLFKSLPSPLEVLEARRSVNYQNQLALHESAKLKNGMDGPFLLDLPESTLRQISRFLDPRSLRAFAGTCRYFASISEATIPYLKLKLYPHQVAAVEWMVQREESREMRNPLVHVFSGAAEGLKVDYALNMATKQGSLVPFEDLEDSRGGLFCDEPGLGKTITSLALVLRTQGLRSSPPPGSRILDDGTYMTMEDIDRVESQRFEAIGIHRSTPRSGRRASVSSAGVRRVVRKTLGSYYHVPGSR
uniref:F-box domain-containing protein n=1 Tax=Rhodosorus marinus TaxID=101924 RepID=A0A7S2ZD47_9RHOD|mmetsp:Transcript_14499/g.58783  ORF Transcript_14499/g.58783 Transcript_14499/m.58783 type:complete len:350 (+) Transcript_14499:208-1257(+)